MATSVESSIPLRIRTARILVVDDDPCMVRLLQEHLSSEGHDVLCGYDGEMAVRVTREERPDVVIMDIRMPLISGVRALGRLRADPETAAIPVIFISCETPQELFQTLASDPNVAHLSKPMNLVHLSATVQMFLHQTRTAAHA